MTGLRLFFTFLEVGALSFGGGYGMISLLREKVLAFGWLSEPEFLQFIAVSESTPGPLAVNMATFIGASQGGFGGAALATFGVVLPSFLVILGIAMLMKNLLRYGGVCAFLGGVRPVIVALILSTACVMSFGTLFSFGRIGDVLRPDVRSLCLLGVIVLVHTGYVLWRKKSPPPIGMLLLGAVLGICFFAGT